MPNTVSKKVELAEKLFDLVGEPGAQEAKNVASAVLPSKRLEVLSLSANLKKAREETANSEAEWNALLVVVQLAKGEHKIALATV